MLVQMREGTPFGAYRLVSLLGRGGMGETWRAVRVDAHGVTKEVALKRILRRVSSTPRFVEAFVAEARVCSQLSHGNIAALHDLGIVHRDILVAAFWRAAYLVVYAEQSSRGIAAETHTVCRDRDRWTFRDKIGDRL